MKSKQSILLKLARDTGGNVLAITAASVFAIMGMVGGAVDMSRTYMAKSRLQQACDAGALAARKNMVGESLTAADQNVGYKFFDFNFRNGDYGATLTSRTYTQPANSAGTPQAIVNGTAVAAVPATIMRVFGQDQIDLTVTCSSKMDIANADVAMVLDVTGSMSSSMKISSSSWQTERRIDALQKAVRAFYNALGPGRAGGDLSKGRIRYAFVPYGTTVNVGYLLNHNQMVSSWNYQSREAVPTTLHGWTTSGNESSANYSSWSPASAPASFATEAAKFENYPTFNTDVVGTGSGSVSYTKLNGSTGSLSRTISGANSTNCATNNNKLVANESNLAAAGKYTADDVETTSEPAPIYPANKRYKTYTNTRVTYAIGFRYRWFKVSNTNACRLESAWGDEDARWTQTQAKTTNRNVTWTDYTGTNYVYGNRTLDVSGLKGSAGAWNATVTISALNRTGSQTAHNNVTLSGSTTPQTVYTGGTAQSVSVDWLGCIEERKMINTITDSTAISTLPSGAYDLDSTLLASSGNDDTRWRPWLPSVVFDPNDAYYSNPSAVGSDSDCPQPALKLQEIGDYENTVITSSYPNLFDAVSGGATSYYYPFQSGSSNAWQNAQTIRNYINRLDGTNNNRLVGGTLHDIGFAWGLHLVSGEGMFASENPDRFNGFVVSRNIVFMTDGEMNPGEERYVFSGYNQYDGRLAPASTSDSGMKTVENRRLRILCEAAKRQGITVWVVAITGSSTDDFDDLRACASSSANFKSAATSNELVSSFTTIAQSIGGLRISQ